MGDGFPGINLCLIGPIPPPSGGMANQTEMIFNRLQQEGAKVSLVATNAPYPWKTGKIPVLRALFRLLPYVFHLFKQIKTSNVVHIMANSGWSWHLFTAPAIWIARLLKKPILLHYHGGLAESFFQSSWKVVHFSLKRVDRCLVPSMFLKEVFEKWGQTAEIVPNAIGQEFLDSLEQCRGKSVKPGTPHLISTRNLEKIYAINVAIQAFAIVKKHYPDAILSVAGSGPEEQELKVLCKTLGVEQSVRFLGRLNSAQMAELYASADVMLNTSLADNLPVSVIEALASSTPVVTTNVGGIPKMVSDGVDAVFFQPDNAQQLAEKINHLLESDELRSSIVANGVKNVQQYLWGSVGPKFLASYTAIIQGKGGR